MIKKIEKRKLFSSLGSLVLASFCLASVSCTGFVEDQDSEERNIGLASVNQSRTASTYSAFTSDSGCITYNQKYDMYTIDGSKVTNGWCFAKVDLSAFDNQTVVIDFSASMHTVNNKNSATLSWVVNDSTYTTVASSYFEKGSSSWRTVSGKKEVKLNKGSVIYLSSYNLTPSDFRITISSLKITVTSTSSGSSTSSTQNAGTVMQKKLSAVDIKTSANNNPICATKFTADPAVLVYKDTVYVYGTNDMQQAEYSLCKKDNAFDQINTLNVYSSKDLVNWTDLGEIQVKSWNKNSWAPAVCTKRINGKDKFFIYFADNGSGIGVLEGDSPAGPFHDPLGKQLISRSTPNTQGVYWLFDPAVLVDTDGRAYLYYGGGVQGDSEHPKSARCVELGDDMISLKGTPQTIDAPWLFEDSGINRFGNKYYYTYCANWASRNGKTNVPPIASIAYMVSSSPLGPFTYGGYTMLNPNNGNDHHWIFSFKGKNYIAYHTQRISEKVNSSGGGYRNVCIDSFKVNADGTLPLQNTSLKGVSQTGSFNAYSTVKASTMHNSLNVVVNQDLSISSSGSNSYVCIKGVDLSKGINSVAADFASKCSNGSVEFVLDSVGGTKIAEISASGRTYASGKSSISKTGTSHDIYIILKGDVRLKDWILK